MFRFWLHASLLITLLSVSHSVRADEPPTAPILRIETGMHTAAIRDLCVDSTGQTLISASEDKTVRVWNLQTGALERTIRPPLGLDSRGLMYAVALSPDGSVIACGGWTDNEKGKESVYLFDRASGQLLRRVSGLTSTAVRLAFSPDGRFLAVTTGLKGLSVTNVADGKIVAQDDDYQGISFGLDFNRAGQIVTACSDGLVRLYDANFKLIKKHATSEGKQPYGVRFSPDGKQIAVGFHNAGGVEVLSATTLEFLFSPIDEQASNQPEVAWSADGNSLFAGTDTAPPCIRRWDEAGHGKPTDIVMGWSKDKNAPSFYQWGALGAVMRILPLSDGRIVWGSSDPMWGVLTTQAKDTLVHIPSIASYSRPTVPFQLSRDGLAVIFGFQQYDKIPIQLDVSRRTLTAMPPLLEVATTQNDDSGPFAEARVYVEANSPLKLEPFAQSFADISVGGKTVPMGDDEKASPAIVAIAPADEGFVAASFNKLHFYNRAGGEVWQSLAPSFTREINISRDGRLLVAAFGDGTIRWYRLSDGVELLAFFPHADQKRWVLWTPQGYYDCSPGGEDLIGWHLNNGRDKAADFFPASRFRDTFYRPDIVGRVLQNLDVEKARQSADAALGKAPIAAADAARVIETQSPPVVRLVKPLDAIQTTETKLTLRYALRTPSGEPVTAIQVLVDGRPVAGENNLNVAPGKESEIERSIEVTLPDRDCEVGLLAINRYSFSVPAFLKVWRGQGRGVRLETDAQTVATSSPSLGKLWVLAVGVEKYDPSLPQLKYSIDDATAIVKAMESQDKAHGGPYQAVETQLLPDADRLAILGGLKWLQQNVAQGDRAIIFLAGHGVNTAEGYYFLPSGCARDEYDANGLPFSKFVSVAPTIKGQVLFLVDTCRSANIMGGVGDFNAALNRLSEPGKGWSVMAASQGDQTAQESGKWGHGAFTRAILEGFDGQGDAATPDGFIYIKRLSSYVDIRVAQMTSGSQTPAFTSFSQSEQLLGRQLSEKILVSRAP